MNEICCSAIAAEGNLYEFGATCSKIEHCLTLSLLYNGIVSLACPLFHIQT